MIMRVREQCMFNSISLSGGPSKRRAIGWIPSREILTLFT